MLLGFMFFDAYTSTWQSSVFALGGTSVAAMLLWQAPCRYGDHVV